MKQAAVFRQPAFNHLGIILVQKSHSVGSEVYRDCFSFLEDFLCMGIIDLDKYLTEGCVDEGFKAMAQIDIHPDLPFNLALSRTFVQQRLRVHLYIGQTQCVNSGKPRDPHPPK